MNSIPDPFSVKNPFFRGTIQADSLCYNKRSSIPFLRDTTTFTNDALCLHVHFFVKSFTSFFDHLLLLWLFALYMLRTHVISLADVLLDRLEEKAC